MEGHDLRQTLVTIGISIVLADLMLAVWGGEIYTFDPPALDLRLDRAAAGRDVPDLPPGRAARPAIVIGVGLWLCLAQHPRRHDDPRRRRRPRHARRPRASTCSWCSPSTFAIGAGLAGFAGVVGGSALSIAPGRGRALSAGLAGRGHRRRHGHVTGAAIGALLIGLAEQFGLVYLPTYGVVLTFVIMVVALAFRPQGIMGKAGMSAAHGGAMNSAATAAAPARCRARRACRAAPARRRRRRRTPARRRSGASASASAPRHLVVLAAVVALSLRRVAVLHLPDRRPVAGSRHDRAVADVPRRLWRHGLPGADDRRRHRRLLRRDLRHQQRRGDQPRLAVVAGAPRSRSLIGHRLRRRARLALGAHRRHLHDHDHAGDRRRVLLLRAAELRALQRLPAASAGSRRRSCSASTGAIRAVLLPRAGLRARPATSSSSTWRARPSASRCRPSATIRGACARSASTSPRTGSPPMPSPASSPRSAAC